MKADLIVRAPRLVTCARDIGDGPLGVIEGAALAASEGRIVWVGRADALRDVVEIASDASVIDAPGAVLPGLVDAHTHLVFAGDRADEFAARMRGEVYTGRGILRTAEATTVATDEELVALATARLDRAAGFGVTTMEAKSGYGLTPDTEVRLLTIVASLQHPVVHLVPTFLGLHALPDGADPDAFTDRMIELIPRSAALGVRFADAWCDEGAFDVEACERFLDAARAHGLALKLHAEQLSWSGGAQLGARLGATSVDHLEHATDDDARALAAAETVAVLLPGAGLMTGAKPAPARMLIESGVRVALATDCNPGSSYSENLPLQIALGCALLGLSVEEAILAVTRHAASALGLDGVVGTLAPGARADLLLLEAPHEAELAYHYGAARIGQVIVARR